MKRYESRHNPAVKDISDYIHSEAQDGGIHPDMFAKITRVLDGIEITDRIISEKEQVIVQKEQLLVQKDSVINQKTTELQSKDNLLVQKEQLLSQKEIEKEHALRSKSVEKNNLLTKKDKEIIELEKVKNELLKKELFEILPQAYPSAKNTGYNKPFEEWDPTWYGKKVLGAGNFKAIERDLPGLREKAAKFKEENLKKQAKELENTKKLEEENIKKEQLLSNQNKFLSDKEQLLVSQSKEIEKLKETLARKEVETQEKNKLLTQKGNELASTEKSLIEKHQKETEALKSLLARKEIEHQEFLARKELEKQELIVQKEKEKKELLTLKEKQAKELENAKRLQEENIKKEQLLSNQNKLLSDKEQRIEELKALIEQSKIEKEELLAKQELAVANKSHMKNQIINQLREEVDLKEDEVVDLRIQNLEKELIAEQKEKLLIQKETEIQEKSFAKNQVIGDLQDDIGLKEKEALNLKIELLMKQVEFHKKESELKDKASELKEKALLDAMEIVKQKDIVNELQGKLLAFQNLSKHDETLQLELSVIHYKVEESIVNGNLEEMKELSKYLSQLMKNPADEDESLDISELLNNLSPVVHGGENQVQNPLAVINNFDINHINTTHSVYPSGEVSESYEII